MSAGDGTIHALCVVATVPDPMDCIELGERVAVRFALADLREILNRTVWHMRADGEGALRVVAAG